MGMRNGSCLLKKAWSVLLALAMVFYLAPGLLLAPQTAWADDGGADGGSDTATVGDLEGLQSALGDSSISKVVVSQAIELDSNIVLDGKGKTIQVETPYLEETGAISEGGCSSHNVFTVNNNASVTLKNMAIYGGKTSSVSSNAGGVSVASGTLTAENITVARSCRGLYVGSGAKASLTDCNIVRNVCGYGGGVLCAGGTLVMDACSLSENRTTQGNGGGGAIEVNGGGKFYANNTVIANNCSAEIGGAVNVYSSNVYLMNCTVAGNVTTKSEESGGGIGINIETSNKFCAVNCIFLGNKAIPRGNGAVEASDIGVHNTNVNFTDNVKLSYCMYGALKGGQGVTIADESPKEHSGDDDVFASYRSDGILVGESGTTSGFSHPQLVSKSSGSAYSLYAPLIAIGSPAASGGVDTYFDKSDLNAVKMSYGSANTALGNLGAADTTNDKATTYYEGGTRASGVIGASGVGNTASGGVCAASYTVKLASQPAGGTITGLTLYGDSRQEGDTVSFTVKTEGFFRVNGIAVKKADGTDTGISIVRNGDSSYSFTMPDYDVVVSVSLVEDIMLHDVKLNAAPVNGVVSGVSTVGESKAVNSPVSFTATPDSGYEVDVVSVAKSGDPGTEVTIRDNGNGSYSFTMPDYNVVVTVTFKASAPVTPPTPSTPSYTPDPAPSVTGSSPTGYGEGGIISDVSSRMQYKLEGAESWTDVPDGVTELTGLPAGTYLVRYKGAGSIAKVVISSAPTYSVEVKAADGGTATADKAKAMRGEAVALSGTPGKGYNLRGWMVAGELVEGSSFTMPAGDVTVEPVFSPVKKAFVAKAKASKKSATLSWKPFEGAVEYRVYLAKAGGKLKRVATVEAPAASAGAASAKVTCSYVAKKLKANSVYKLRVVAVDEDGSKITQSPVVYVTPKASAKLANAAKVSVSEKRIALSAGEKVKVSAKVIRLDGKGKKYVKASGVRKIRFVSSEPEIAKVSKYGTITALSSGTAYVYPIAPDGVCKRITVEVHTA